MKGVLFTEFLEMVESRFGIETADEIIERAPLPSGGAYTAVGTYDYAELLTLVTRLSERSGERVPTLLRSYGRHLLGQFASRYPNLFEGINSSFEFLAGVDACIHVEVRKLYPDAELPVLEVKSLGADQMEMVYRSPRPFADLVEGLIEGCAAHFDEQIQIERETMDRRGIRFVLTSKSGVPSCRI